MHILIDANVLFCAPVRDTILRSAEAGLCSVSWTGRILEEAVGGLLSARRVSRESAKRLIEALNAAFPKALVNNPDSALVASMRNHQSDRHVTAAAVLAGASAIVTFNVRHFRWTPAGVITIHPDPLLLGFLDHDRDRVLEVVLQQSSTLRRPPMTVMDVLIGLSLHVPDFAAAVRKLLIKP